MKPSVFLREAFRSFAGPTSKELAELTLWGLLAILAMILVILPGDQVMAGIDWLIRSLE